MMSLFVITENIPFRACITVGERYRETFLHQETIFIRKEYSSGRIVINIELIAGLDISVIIPPIKRRIIFRYHPICSESIYLSRQLTIKRIAPSPGLKIGGFSI